MSEVPGPPAAEVTHKTHIPKHRKRTFTNRLSASVQTIYRNPKLTIANGLSAAVGAVSGGEMYHIANDAAAQLHNIRYASAAAISIVTGGFLRLGMEIIFRPTNESITSDFEHAINRANPGETITAKKHGSVIIAYKEARVQPPQIIVYEVPKNEMLVENITQEEIKNHFVLIRNLAGIKTGGREYLVSLPDGNDAILKLEHYGGYSHSRLWKRIPDESDNSVERFGYSNITIGEKMRRYHAYRGEGTIVTPRQFNNENILSLKVQTDLNTKQAANEDVEDFQIHLDLVRQISDLKRRDRRPLRIKRGTMQTKAELQAA